MVYNSGMATGAASRAKIEIPQEELKDFCQRYQIKTLALFGSVLDESFRSKSDVDVLVSFQPDARIGFITFSRMQRELSALFNRPVDLVPMDGLKPVLRDSVLSDMEEVYAA
jgi:predicted nucleotidyltransferase